MLNIIHYGLNTNKGGIETYLYKLYRNIDKGKYHFDFIDTNIEKACYYDEFIKMGCKFFKIVPRKISFSRNRKELNSLFQSNRFDILHCHMNTLSDIEPIKAALKNNCAVILHSRSAGLPKSLLTKLLHYINTFFIPKNHIKMIAVSNIAGILLFGRNSSFSIINNGIETDRFIFNEKKRMIIRSEFRQEDRYIVGHVGSLSYSKNHKFIISVFQKLLQKKSNAVLWLIGSGPLESDIRKRIFDLGLNDQVYLFGNKSNIPDLLSAMDAFIFPSLYEGFPNAVLEAQTSGLPCVISDTITNEVVITENCIQLPLSLSAENWADKLIVSTSIMKREQGVRIIKEAGLSVEDEIIKIEKIYSDVGEK